MVQGGRRVLCEQRNEFVSRRCKHGGMIDSCCMLPTGMSSIYDSIHGTPFPSAHHPCSGSDQVPSECIRVVGVKPVSSCPWNLKLRDTARCQHSKVHPARLSKTILQSLSLHYTYPTSHYLAILMPMPHQLSTNLTIHPPKN